MSKKCIAIQLPVDLLEKINELKTKTGQSQNALMTSLIEKGLGYSSNEKQLGEALFFVKVRIDTSKMMEFGQKLQSGQMDTSHTIMTYCSKNDPTVGLSFWHANSREEFENVFAQHCAYYKEVMEITEAVTPMEAMKLIMGTHRE
jgi:hypothetical protein